MNETVEKVKAFAAQAHEGQKRKYTPEHFIVHPVKVMEICSEYTSSTPVLSAALLHDVLEDTSVSEEGLKQFLLSVMNEEEAHQTLQLVIELTDVYIKADYPQWNRRKRKQKEAQRIEKTSGESQTVKYADIIDNCTEIIHYDEEFGPRFLRECKSLLQVMSKGNAQLRDKAKAVVEQGLAEARYFIKQKR